jgi:uncharacterized membrane protein (DUF485 family)
VGSVGEFFRVKDVTPQRCDRISRVRRAWYSFTSTLFCLLVPVVFVLMGFESVLAQKVAEGLFSFAELMAILYLSAGVIDRADIGRHIANRFARHDPPPRDYYQRDELEPR